MFLRFANIFSRNANCGGDSYDNQEDADLGDGNGRFDESISSYICVRQ